MAGGFAFIIGVYYLFVYVMDGIVDKTWMPLGYLILGLLFLGWSLASEGDN